jgi:hypothetical protein
VAIDELHCVDQWGSFREEYKELYKTRTRIPTRIPWFGTSATLDPMTMAISMKGAGFTNPVILRTTIDRPDIFYEIRRFNTNPGSFEDLRFLIPEKICSEDIQKLPKIIIYMKSTKDIRSACRRLQSMLVQAGLTLAEARSTIQPFYASLSTKTKDRVADDFRMASSIARIILATDAMGMGVGNEAVELVIQYGIDKIVTKDGAMKTVMQRLGRAARTISERGHFIWLVPNWVFPPPESEYAPLPENSSNLRNVFTVSEDGTVNEDNAGISKKEGVKKRSAMTPTFQRLFDPKICIREVMLKFFKEPTPPNGIEAHRPRLCCNSHKCQPEHSWPSRQSKSPEERAAELYDVISKRKEGDIWELKKLPSSFHLKGWQWLEGTFEENLRKWRDAETEKRYGNSTYLIPGPEFILPNNIMERLIKMNTHCESVDIIKHFFPDWPDRFEHARAIAEIAKASSFVIKKDGEEKNLEIKAAKNSAAKEAARAKEARKARLKEAYAHFHTPEAIEAAKAEEAEKTNGGALKRRIHRKNEKKKDESPRSQILKRGKALASQPASQRETGESSVPVTDDEYGSDTVLDNLQLSIPSRTLPQPVDVADGYPEERRKGKTKVKMQPSSSNRLQRGTRSQSVDPVSLTSLSFRPKGKSKETPSHPLQIKPKRGTAQLPEGEDAQPPLPEVSAARKTPYPP